MKQHQSLHSKELSPYDKNLSPHMYDWSSYKMMCFSIYQRNYPSLQCKSLSLRHMNLSLLNFQWLKPISEVNINATCTMRRWQASYPVCGLSWQHHFGTLCNCLYGHIDWLLIQSEVDKSALLTLPTHIRLHPPWLAVSTKPLNVY